MRGMIIKKLILHIISRICIEWSTSAFPIAQHKLKNKYAYSGNYMLIRWHAYSIVLCWCDDIESAWLAVEVFCCCLIIHRERPPTFAHCSPHSIKQKYNKKADTFRQFALILLCNLYLLQLQHSFYVCYSCASVFIHILLRSKTKNFFEITRELYMYVFAYYSKINIYRAGTNA